MENSDPKITIKIWVNGKKVKITAYEFRSFWFQVDLNHKDFPELQKISGQHTTYKTTKKQKRS